MKHLIETCETAIKSISFGMLNPRSKEHGSFFIIHHVVNADFKRDIMTP